MTPTLRLEGADELDANLKKLEGLAAEGVAKRAMTSALAPVAAAARAIVAYASGALQRSIGVGAGLTKRQKRQRRPLARVEVYVGPGIANKEGKRAVARAHLVEFGTVKMAPRPFMRPAWAANVATVFGNLAGNMTEELRAIVAKMKVG